jgi:hypothetical protein
MADASAEPAPAEIAYVGEWRIDTLEMSGGFSFALTHQASRRGAPASLADLGLSAEQLTADVHPLYFEVRRDAGTFACLGTAGNGHGSGQFRFCPDPAYEAAIAQAGLAPLPLHHLIKAGMFDITQPFVEAIAAIGLPRVTFAELLSLKIARITPDDVRAFHADLPGATLDEIATLGMMRITPAFVGLLRRAQITGLSFDNVSGLHASGVDEAFVDGLIASGKLGLSIDEVVDLYRKGT